MSYEQAPRFSLCCVRVICRWFRSSLLTGSRCGGTQTNTKEEEACCQANVAVNNAGFTYFSNGSWGNRVRMFVRPPGYIQQRDLNVNTTFVCLQRNSSGLLPALIQLLFPVLETVSAVQWIYMLVNIHIWGTNCQVYHQRSDKYTWRREKNKALRCKIVLSFTMEANDPAAQITNLTEASEEAACHIMIPNNVVTKQNRAKQKTAPVQFSSVWSQSLVSALQHMTEKPKSYKPKSLPPLIPRRWKRCSYLARRFSLTILLHH